MKSHAQVPSPLLCGDIIRVYFASRPEHTLSQTVYLDLDIHDPARILRIQSTPILELGGRGTFDEHGIMPGSAVWNGDRVFLYYFGWSRGASVPYVNSTGLAISEDGGETFRKAGAGPILARSLCDPYSVTSPYVLKEGDRWHMWYCSGTGWFRIAEKLEHTYDIKYAWSSDGIAWNPSPEPAIAQRSQYEAITRPCVLKTADGHHMWFCYRDSHDFRGGLGSYRMGYAWSRDMRQWERRDEAASIEPSETGWDSQMMAYPAVVTINQRAILFYNGNGFGETGFGYATAILPEAGGRA
jgi:hypothetical protein